MKRFKPALLKALSVIQHPMYEKNLSNWCRENGIYLMGVTRIIKEAGIKSHTKCNKRRNVFTPGDLLGASSIGLDPSSVAQDTVCPFATSNGCALLNNNLTLPVYCITRMVKENRQLSPVLNRVKKVNRYLKTTVRLLGVTK